VALRGGVGPLAQFRQQHSRKGGGEGVVHDGNAPGPANVGPERISERREGEIRVGGFRPALQDEPSLATRPRRDLSCQPGLTSARFTDKLHSPSVPEGRPETSKRLISPDHHWAGSRQEKGRARHRMCPDRLPGSLATLPREGSRPHDPMTATRPVLGESRGRAPGCPYPGPLPRESVCGPGARHPEETPTAAPPSTDGARTVTSPAMRPSPC